MYRYITHVLMQVYECYTSLGDWKDAEDWHHRSSMQYQHQYPELTSQHYDINKIQ